MSQPGGPAPTAPDPTEMFRTQARIAYIVIFAGVLGIAAVSGVAIWLSADKDQMSRLVFTSAVALLGTWVGAVLAFYYSSNALHAGSSATLTAVQATRAPDPARTSAASVMIQWKDINPRIDASDATTAKQEKISALYEQMNSSGRSRVPIFVAQVALYVVHEPDIDKYAQTSGVKADALPDTATVDKLAADAAIGPAISSLVAVAPTATLEEARAQLKTVSEAKDIFVTHDGSISGQVLGWITNSDIARAG